MDYKHKKLAYMESHNFVRRYLFTAWWRHRLDRLHKQALYVAV